MTRLSLGVLAALTALVAAAPAGAAQPQRADRPLRDADVRRADGGPVSPAERRARGALAQRLGDEGVVSTDPVTGAVRLVARTDGFLTARRAAAPADVALDYVRDHPDVFGLSDADLGGLRLTSRYRTPDGVTHLAYIQTYLGIGAYDNVLLANVDRDGRLLNVGGSAVRSVRVDSIEPGVGAEAALAAARRQVGGTLVPPAARQGSGPERPTRFAGGDSAHLTLFNDGATTRLGWALLVTGTGDLTYEIVVDATSGAVLKRRSLTDFVSNASVYDNFPGAPTGGTATTFDLALDASWLNRSLGNTRLSGNNAHAYIDQNTTDGFTAGQDAEVPASAGGVDWLYPLAIVPGQTCPAPGCTWNSADPATRATNANQATTQLFYYVNRFHDHLAASPIDFTAAARNFEFAGPVGTGGDPVQAETDNYLNDPNGPSRPPAPPTVDNSSMTTLPDGTPPVLQVDLFTVPGARSLDAADTADVVYHEYTHGLTNRSVGSGIGLDAKQSQAMGEGWSDWYALDYLETLGLRTDAPGTRGEMTMGAYLVPGGFRTQGADCPVGATAPACPGSGPGNRGGYTLGDMGHIFSGGFEVHADGEIWLETLWDIRAVLGSGEAERLVTSGLRLSPNNPSFLEERDAILLADRQSGGAHYQQLWTVFAQRGMGFSARVTSSAATTATEAFDLPPRLVHESTTISDPAPGADGDDVAEPGETVSVVEELRNPFAPLVGAVGAVLSTQNPLATVTQPAASWPDIAPNLTRTNTPPFRVAISPSAACDTTVGLNLAMTTDAGNFTIPLQIPLGSKPSDDVPKLIPPAGTGVDSALTFSGPGTVQGLKVRIDRLSHTFVGDLRITLTSPLGTTVTLMNSPGTSPATTPPSPDFGASGDDFVNLVLDDGATTAIESIDPLAPGPFSGSFRPDQPLAAFNGEDRQGTWILHVDDLFGSQDSGTLQGWGLRPSTLDCANSAPIAVDDSYNVAAGHTLSGSSVLANDTDADGNTLTAIKQSDPAHGSVVLAADGTFLYTPTAGFRGTDSFTYRAADPTSTSPAPAVVTIVVGNNAPTAGDDAYAVAHDGALGAVNVLANDSDADGDPLTAAAVSRPAHGTAELASDGTLAYTPTAGFSGVDTFTYVAADNASTSAPATVAITVAAAAAPPPPPPPPPPVITPRAPAKLQVLRAGVSGGRLDVLASITSRATGNVSVRYRSGGRTTTFEAAIAGGQIRFRKVLPPAQRAKPTGIFSLTFAGTTLVQPDSVQLRAAAGRAQLVRTASRIDASGTLRVAGTISRRVRGVVRVRLGVVGAGDTVTFLSYTAKIAAGRWSLVQKLPPAAAKAGGQLSIQFTGYEALRIRGEQISKEVSPAG